MESEENIAGGYSAAGGWAGSASDSGPQSGANVGSKDFGKNVEDRPQGPAIGGMDLSPGLTRSVYGTIYGTQLAGLNQEKFNDMFSITDKNPYGKFGKMTSLLGIPPDFLDYTQMSLQNRKAIANNQFSKFANPQNMKGLPGYNPNFDTAPPGQVRSGVQKAGYMTAFGPVMEQAREQSIGEMLARGAMGLFGGLPGTALGQIGTTEYGLPGLPGFDSFDPNNPNAGGGILGAMLGGLNPSQAADKAAQAVDSLRARFSPTLAPTTNAGIGSLTPANYETRADIRNRLSSTNPLSGETSVTSAPSSIVDGLNGFQTEKVPGGYHSVNTIGDMTEAEAEAIKNRLEAYNFYSDPDVEVEYPSATTGEQLAGGLFDSLFRDPNISPEARQILKEKGMTIDDLFAPKTSTPEPEKPNIMDLLQGITQTSALGGPTTLIT